jgi:murein DD-endopeptidase MepM/ murein hydrolase activator NlpD
MGGLQRVVVLVAAANLAGVGVWHASAAQLPPITLVPPTTTAQPPAEEAPTPDESSTTTSETVPGGDAPVDESTTSTEPATEPAVDTADPGTAPGAGATPEEGGDGGADAEDPASGRVVPADARLVIDSVARTGVSDSSTLVAAAEALVARGLAEADAIRVAFGHFPVAGPASWSDDWLFPRWTGTQFRYHLGCDVMAAYGTPVRAVTDGVVRFSESALGGLGLYLTGDDGTVFYYAHLGALAEGLVAQQRVATGDVVGYVGDSGNAAGTPHLHFAVHPAGGGAVPPKPYLDAWVAHAQAQVATLLAAVAPPRRTRALVATSYLRTLADASEDIDTGPAGPPRTDLLFASSANPAGGGLHLADASAAAAARTVDWEARALRQRAFIEAWTREAHRARTVLDPLSSAVLVDAIGARSSPGDD